MMAPWDIVLAVVLVVGLGVLGVLLALWEK